MNLTYLYPWLAAGALAYLLASLAAVVLAHLGGPEQALAAFTQPAQTIPPGPGPAVGSRAYKIQLAYGKLGLSVTGLEQPAFILTVVGLGLLLSLPLLLLDLPSVTWLAGPGLAFFLLNAWLESTWAALQRALEKEIPTLLMRLAGMVQATPDVLQALAEVTASLDPHKPLQAWMQGLVSSLQKHGVPAFAGLEREARVLSPSLLLAVIEIRRLWETGGQGYAAAFQLAAEHLSALLATRALAYAKAGGAWGTARIVIFGAMFSLGFILLNPTSKALFLSNPLTQLGLVGLVLWGGLGWQVINTWVKEAIQ